MNELLARVLQWNALSPRIVNGEDAKAGEIPYQVSLQTYGYHFCGGSVLNENYVITAAHCVVGQEPYYIKVVAATLKLSEPKVKREIERIIVHKGYDSKNSWKNDIALLKVKIPFKISDELKTVLLPKSNLIISENQKAVVSGWGSLKFGGYAPDHLQRADLVISGQEFCREAYKEENLSIHDSQICAFDPDVKKGACHGDSGGPLTVEGKLVGLVSWSKGCAEIDHPTVYTRVSKFLDWIDENAI
ncbi:mite allergen Der p 3-like [Belonocnema kinseyi]|uniref:mite allergen Der p 3-like n=1 Tax=Belonocnema kinseyi TaxID=2817044 RepID=UPI00143D13C4|nr:mite allergen Der p 3-like [Belonocnema kinseyi]